MGIMTFMRTKMGYLLVGGIAVVLALFVLEPLLQQGSSMFGSSRNVVGSIDGNDVKFEEFQPKVDQSLNQYKQQFGGSLNPQMTAMAVDQAWNSELAGVLLTKEYDRLGLTVSEDELFDLLQGQNPSPIIKQYFSNPKTGQVDRATLMNFLKSKDAQALQQSNMLQQEIKNQSLQAKYSNLVRNSVYVTSLEATDEYNNRNKLANFKYVALDYSTIADASVKLTDADYAAFYDENKARFNNPQESRTFDYVSFSIRPTAADSLAVKTQIEKIANDFRVSKNDSLFAAINSDVKVPYTYLSKGKLGDAALDSAVFALPAGSFYGPALTGNSYKLIKVIDTRFSPDSVKVKHILIDLNKVGGDDKAIKLADSLKGLIAKGGNFAELAKTYSIDGSKDQGGELPSFSRGQMVPEFENAAFNGKAGDLKVVKSQFGYHIMSIERQMGNSKVAKLAYIEKSLAASSKTQQTAYKAASNFLSEVKGKDFAKYAQEKGLKLAVADKITATQGFAAGLDNPRKLIQDGYAADKGDVLPEIYTMTNEYVVARLTAVNPKGILPLEAVKKEIQPLVLNEVKAKKLKEKFNGAGKASLDQIAAKVGAAVNPVQNIVFANPVIPGVAQENKLVGSVFGSQPGKVSAPVAGDRGVYVFAVDGFTNPAPIANMFKQKESMLMSIGQRSGQAAFQALIDNAKIKDNRVKFY